MLVTLLSLTFHACQEPEQIAANKPVELKAAASANSSHFPLFQLFLAKTNAECDQKVNDMINHFFYNSSTRIYKEAGTDMAYIHNVQNDANNNDVRSEGMSYGMMICVQLNMRTEFDKLWRWAKTYMLNTSGNLSGYFAWRCNINGTKIDSNPASDGEEYFAMALYFANNRWGSTSTFNYKQDADNILTAMLATHGGNVTPMFGSNNLIVFQPVGNGATFSDPSYHLPAFYELFAQFGPASQKDRWEAIADASRAYLKLTVSKNANGLVPDYATFSGDPTGGEHADFRYDAWRTIMNVVIDNTFSKEAYADYGELGSNNFYFSGEYANRMLYFFESKNSIQHTPSNPYPARDYVDRYTLSGTSIGSDHSVGLVAMSAVAARASNQWSLILRAANEFWNIGMQSDQYRYYGGCLYMLGMLYCTGNYNIYGSDGNVKALNFSIGEGSGFAPVSFSSQWTGKHLTLTGTQNDAETKAQPENTTWTSQDWKIETIAGSGNVRVKNVWSGKYLNVQNQNENAKIVCYDLNTSWLSQQWKIEPVQGTGSVRLKSAWSGKYLTVETNGDYANILAKSLNTSWTSQNWVMK